MHYVVVVETIQKMYHLMQFLIEKCQISLKY